MKSNIVVILAAVIAVSGCTTDSIATEQDLKDQTSELKQHTEQQLEQDNNLVREYRLTKIEFQGMCSNESSRSLLPDDRVFERDGGIQEFSGGSYLVRNGIDVRDIDVPWCGHDMEIYSLQFTSVSFNKTIYQNGSEISSASETCYPERDTEFFDIVVRGEYRSEIEEHLGSVAKGIYTECLGIPADDLGPLWGDS